MDYLNLGSLTDIKISYDKPLEDTYVLKFQGQLDTYNTTSVSKAFSRFFEDQKNDIKSLVLDLEALHYVSSTGIGLMVEIFKETKENSVELYLMNIVDNVMDVLKLLGFSTLFNTISSLEEIKGVKQQVFPKVVQCPSCGSKFKVMKSGAYKCSSCKHIFRVNSKGDLVES